jgi:hypothetical protein
MSIRASISAFAHRGAHRRQALELLLYSGGLVVVLLLLSTWICTQGRLAPPPYQWNPNVHIPPIPWNELALADIFALGLLGLGLFVLAPAAVAATVAAERRAGTLDQLRTTPLDPLALLCGLVIGAPARFYLLCAGPLALHVVAGVTGVIPLETLLSTLVTLGVGGVACMLLALVLALAPRQDTGGAFIALGVAALLGISGFVAICLAQDRSAVNWAFLHPAGALNAAMLSHDGLWRHLSIGYYSLDKFDNPSFSGALSMTPLYAALFAIVGGGLLARAACRKLGAPHLPLLGKGQALALFSLVAAGLILPFDESGPSYRMADTVPLVLGMFLLPLMALIGLFATPVFEAWALQLRGGRRVGWWKDEGKPHVAVWSMSLVFVLLLVVRLHALGFPELLHGHHAFAFVWAMGLAVTLPIYMLFATTRYGTPGTRWAFGVAIAAHLLFQVISIGLLNDGYLDSTAWTVVEIGAVAGVLVPLWVLYRQRVLKTRTLAGIVR